MVSEQTPQQMGLVSPGRLLATDRAAGERLTYDILSSQHMTRDELDDVAWTKYIRHPLSEWKVG